jgi:phage antirepressor YoqD-like protein
MNLDNNIKQAIVAEPKVSANDAVLTVEGQVDLDDLAMVIAGALAGGP